jgi:sulfite exporter TauE/SafE
MIDPLLGMALATGFLGSGHCLGMCGGLVAALALSAQGRQGGVPFQLLYHAGRLLTYGGIGLLVGWLGSVLAYTDRMRGLTQALLLASDLLIVLAGLGSAGLFARLRLFDLEFAAPLRLLTRSARSLHRWPPALAALPLGVIFGLLPCGFLYAMAFTAAQSASALTGSLVLLAFGLGTVPALLLFGGSAQLLSRRARSWMLRGAGLLVAVMGGLNLWRHLQLLGWLQAG